MAECRAITCCLATNAALGDFSDFSLVGGDFPGGSVSGNNESTFIIDCPEGATCVGGVYPYVVTIGPDTLFCPYCEFPPNTPIYLRVPCGDQVFTRLLAPGTSLAEINATIEALFTGCGQRKAEDMLPPNTATVANRYCNEEIDPIQCDGKKFESAPGGLLVFNNTTKLAKLPAGTHCSYDYANREEANLAATSYVEAIIDKYKADGGKCGYWNTEQQRCEPDGPTAAANTFFSEVSQEAADDEALESLPECGCNDTVSAWTWNAPTGGMTGSGDGPNATFAATGVGTLTTDPFNSNPSGFSCILNLTVTATNPGSTNGIRIEQAVGPDLYDSGVITPQTLNISIPVTINSSGAQTISISVYGGKFESGTFNMGPTS